MRGFQEKGQAMLEAAILLPALLAIGFLGMQSFWVLHCGDALTFATEHVCNTIRPGDEMSGDDAAGLVRMRLIEAQPFLASGELEVRDAHITQDSPTIESVDLSDEDFDNYSIAAKNLTSSKMHVSAHITYTPPALFSQLTPTYERDVNKAILVEERFELG